MPTALRLAVALASLAPAAAQDLPLVEGVEPQPLAAQAQRVAQALEHAGAPLSPAQAAALQAAVAAADPTRTVAGIQRVFDPLCLALVHVNPESRVKVAPGPAPRELAQHGWRLFLVKVHNEAGVTAKLRCLSPNAELPYRRSSNAPEPPAGVTEAGVRDRWLEVDTFDERPLTPTLSGLELEYRMLLLYSRDAGPREAKLAFDVGQGSQDLGFRNELDVLFECAPSVPVTLRVRDVDGKPTTAGFVVRDTQGRVHPTRTRRLEPDFFFHDQVYRADGEELHLTPGTYRVSFSRGPEYRKLTRSITVPAAEAHEERFELERWIDLASLGWYSGDHHVHAAGCAHYDAPSEGVGPEAMMRHILGEDLNVGCVLTWGPCWYSQKQFFDGQTHALSRDRYLMRYDVEVSGFPSSHAGHICLLRLSEDDFPGTTRIDQWPSWDLPILQWARAQGAVVGFAHSGWGLAVEAQTPPTFEMPAFDSIGANEYVVDVVHGAVDFISTVDTPAVWELNVWYHTLSCGYTTRISGETDFPCIYGERVGLGRSYVRLDGAELTFDDWVIGVRDGRSYVSDGLSHLIDFTVGELAVGAPGEGGRPSVLAAKRGERLTVRARVAALLEETPREDLRSRPLEQKPYWHVERARIGDTRTVAVELVVNGQVAAVREVAAEGEMIDVEFELEPQISSWVALRIFPSSHTNPVFIELDGRPIRASRRSAEWCAEAVEVCWRSKQRSTREEERAAARAAYDVAAAAYRRIAEEAEGD